MAEYISENSSDTERIAEAYAKTLSAGDVVLLKGEMGAGKTVFAKGVARALGITAEVTSPTYAYMNHYDCYRLSCGEDAESLGLTDYFSGNGICLVEWSENIADVLPENAKTVIIEKISENKRKITL